MKRIVWISIIIIFIIMISTYICARDYEENYHAELIIDCEQSKQLKKGEKVSLDILIKNITIPNGIALWNGMLEYDSEKIEVEVLGNGEWDVYYQKDNNITIASKDLKNKKEDTILGKIVLTAKEEIEIKDNIIRLVNNEVTDGERSYKINDSDIQREELELNFGRYEIENEAEGNYLENIYLGTTIEELNKEIQTNAEIRVYKQEELITNQTTRLQTGMKLEFLLKGESQKEYTIVVTGDLNGDGLITDIDLLKMIRYKVGADQNLHKEYLKATDIFKDKIYGDNKDLLKLVRILVGIDNL